MEPEQFASVQVEDLIRRGILAMNDGYRVRNVELGTTGIPFVRGGDIGDGDINTSVADHIRPEYADRVASKLTQPLDVAFITKGTVGRVGIMRHGQPASVFAPQVCYWRSLDTDQLDPRFLFYLLRSAEFQANLDAVKTHGSMVADYVSMSDQRLFRLSFPPIRTQRYIGRVLGALDDKIEMNRRMNRTLEGMARAIFKSWFVDFDPVRAKAAARRSSPSDQQPPGLQPDLANLFPDRFEDSELGEIPKGWRVVTVGDVVDAVKGRSYKSDELQPSDTALVTLKSFARGGGYRDDGLKPFTGTFKPEQVIEPGEVVIACTDVTQAAEVIGRTAIVQASPFHSRLIASLDTMILRPRNGQIARAFLYYLGRTDSFVSHTYAHTTGTTVLHMAKNAVPSYEFAMPPANLMVAFDRVAAPAMERVAVLEQESRTLAALRDALLPELISGDLRVPDAERIVGRIM
jgi:type I restriction enzyme S subunit